MEAVGDFAGPALERAVAASFEHLDGPRALEAVRTSISGRRAIDVAAVKVVVGRYLAGSGKGFVVEVLPEGLNTP